MEDFIYYGQKIFIAFLIFSIIYIFVKLERDSKNVSSRLPYAKAISFLEISKMVSHRFFLDRENDSTGIKMYTERGFIYLYFTGNSPVFYSNGPFVICKDKTVKSLYWMKYYVKKIDRNNNGQLKLVFATKNTILFSKYSITIKYISEQDFLLIKENLSII